MINIICGAVIPAYVGAALGFVCAFALTLFIEWTSYSGSRKGKRK